MNKPADDNCGDGAETRVSGFSLGLFALVTAVCIGLTYYAVKNFVTILGVLAYGPVRGGGQSDYYSHIILIPFMSAYFLFQVRKSISQSVTFWPCGGAVAAVGFVVFATALWARGRLDPNDFASLATAGAILGWWGGFLLSFGPAAFRAAAFPLLFMLFVIPLPRFLIEGFIDILQVGSNEITQWLFELTGTNYARDGFVYQLTGINIEVAKECSGIRSTIALIITSVVVGHLFLRSGWTKLTLLVVMIPISIIKNGIRIVTLSLLAVYVDRKFITNSFLHHSGGFLFYLPALGMMAAMVIWMRKREAKKEGSDWEGKKEPDSPRIRTDGRG